MPKITCKITGIVQGVFLRAHIKEQADLLHIVGWVKNEEDGSVSLEAQHFSEDILKDFIELLQDGSSLSNIEHVEVNWSEAEEDLNHFLIEH